VIVHTPVTTAEPGLPLTILADVTDNVGVQGVTLYFRGRGGTVYQSRGMTLVSGNRYAATIEGSWVSSPGLDYYLEASDGVNTVRSGQPELPNTVVVVDQPVVTGVSPESGPASGGALLTIAGGNFKAGATVMVGGVAASNLVWVSSSQLTCVTPAHFPAVVDVQVRNPDGQVGTLLRGFVFVSDTVSLSLPDTAGAQGDIVGVPVSVGNVEGLVAVDLTVTFNAGVLRGVAGRPGTLTAGWSLAVNTNTAGQVKVSLASPGGTVSGTGSLVLLDLQAIGAPGTNSLLQLTNARLNDGAILLSSTNGSFAVVRTYRVSGKVTFWKDGRGVPGVQQTLSGDRVFTGTTDTNGAYTTPGASAGTYTLTPRKSDMVNGITAYDASLVLRHAAGLTNLTGSAATAADVNQSGQITSMDAFYILEKAVGLITLPFPGAGAVWVFSPASRPYPNLNIDQSGQDFTAVLLGDVSGNWSPTGTGVIGGGGGGQWDVLVGVDNGPLGQDSKVARVLLQTTNPVVYGIDLALSYSPTNRGVIGVALGSLGQSLAFAVNTNEPGLVLASLASAIPISGNGSLLVVSFAGAEPLSWHLERFSVNEDGVVVQVDSGNTAFDSDGDGLIDLDEVQLFHTDPKVADTDKDGMPDGAEVRAGTDPNNPASYLGISKTKLQGDGSLALTFMSVAGKRYQLESRVEAAEGVWQVVGAIVQATGPTTTVTDRSTSQSGRRFYRVRLVE
jgi:hypothetical protein